MHSIIQSAKKSHNLIHAVIPAKSNPDKYWLNQLNKND